MNMICVEKPQIWFFLCAPLISTYFGLHFIFDKIHIHHVSRYTCIFFKKMKRKNMKFEFFKSGLHEARPPFNIFGSTPRLTVKVHPIGPMQSTGPMGKNLLAIMITILSLNQWWELTSFFKVVLPYKPMEYVLSLTIGLEQMWFIFTVKNSFVRHNLLVINVSIKWIVVLTVPRYFVRT